MRHNPFRFPLGDLLEKTMTTERDQNNQQPSATVRSTRWSTRRTGLSLRATVIAGIMATLILAIVVATIYVRFSTPRASSPAVATTSARSFSKVGKRLNPNATIGGLATGQDRSLWFTESVSLHDHVGRLSLDGTLTEYPVLIDQRAQRSWIGDITVGPDGNLWFPQSQQGPLLGEYEAIARMTPEGAMTEFTLPNDIRAVTSIIAGPDGALWFGAAISGRFNIGRITNTGQISSYQIASSTDRDALRLCVGPDNAIWYSLWATPHIGRMTMSGENKEFTVQYIGGQITPGPDGALWFSELLPIDQRDANSFGSTGFIGRITTSGVYHEVPISPSQVVSHITAGPDGAVWFSAFDRADSTLTLGRIAADGAVKLYPTKEFGEPGPIVVASDAIWMLDSGNNTLWRYRLPA
jgi:virginiamycin B lyase